ncbi:MAG: hypothetical protein NZ749_14685, partial [bacterium]|nr:hypothetical protein [bacterium]
MPPTTLSEPALYVRTVKNCLEIFSIMYENALLALFYYSACKVVKRFCEGAGTNFPGNINRSGAGCVLPPMEMVG